MRELHILQQVSFKELDSRFFGLHTKENGVVVTQGKTVDETGDISALDEELSQSDRYMNVEMKLADNPAEA
jgi:hypothetical protein